MLGYAKPLLVTVAVGAGLSALLVLLETLLGVPQAVRLFGGGGLVALGALLTSGGSGRVLFEKAAVRAIDEADRREYVATRSRNLSAGVYLMIVGAVMFASLFVV